MSNTKLVSHDGRTVQVQLMTAPTTLGYEGAIDYGAEIINAAADARNLPSVHERHVNLKASCALCVYEANGQLDRLEEDED